MTTESAAYQLAYNRAYDQEWNSLNPGREESNPDSFQNSLVASISKQNQNVMTLREKTTVVELSFFAKKINNDTAVGMEVLNRPDQPAPALGFNLTLINNVKFEDGVQIVEQSNRKAA